MQAIGEQMVLAANGRGGHLATCALRPSAIFGEGGALLLPTLVKRAKQGKMKGRAWTTSMMVSQWTAVMLYMIGSGENIQCSSGTLNNDLSSLDSPAVLQASLWTSKAI